MINRELIRLKTVHIVYAYYINDGRAIETAENELMLSLGKAHEMYMQLLILLTNLNHMATRIIETEQARARRLGEEPRMSAKLLQNSFMQQLKENKMLNEFKDKNPSLWMEDEDFLRRLWAVVQQQDFYTDYALSSDQGYDEDRELWRKIYRHVICNNNDVDEILENACLYWNDDKVVVDTFVLKTIKRFSPEKGADQELLPEFSSPDDEKFARQLLRNTLRNADYYRQEIQQQTRNWELERMPFMDVVIMQTALCEMLTFPNIPISVSINEYVEIAKEYSTPRSASYVNGVLDSIAHRLNIKKDIQ